MRTLLALMLFVGVAGAQGIVDTGSVVGQRIVIRDSVQVPITWRYSDTLQYLEVDTVVTWKDWAIEWEPKVEWHWVWSYKGEVTDSVRYDAYEEILAEYGVSSDEFTDTLGHGMQWVDSDTKEIRTFYIELNSSGTRFSVWRDKGIIPIYHPVPDKVVSRYRWKKTRKVHTFDIGLREDGVVVWRKKQ